MAINPFCEVRSPVCTGMAQGGNHIQKKTPKNYADPDNIELSCHACNGFIENNVQWAIDNGHQKSKFAK